jgi:Fur family transcriptional regulator, ferric uptake regulator
MSHTRINLKAYMNERGARMTPQRQIILDVICEGNGLLTLDEIYHLVQQRSPAINLATIYRNLDFLCKVGLVAACRTSQGESIYEIVTEQPHHHLVCRKCGYIIEIAGEELDILAEKLQGEYGFQLEQGHFTLFGLCETCNQTRAAKSLD